MVLAGDWRQQLPVIKNAGNDAQIIGSTLKASSLWANFTTFQLVENMRLRSLRGNADGSIDEAFRLKVFGEWLLGVGDGILPRCDSSVYADSIELPEQLCLNGDNYDAAIDWVYQDLEHNAGDAAYFGGRRIFGPYIPFVTARYLMCENCLSDCQRCKR